MSTAPTPSTTKAGLLGAAERNASKAGANLATLAIVLIMIVTVVDVVTRGISARSVPGMIESAEIILVAAAFLGLGYAQRMKAHVSTSIFMDALPPAMAHILRRAGLLVVVVYATSATFVSARRAWDAFQGGEVRFGLIEIPQWPARAAIAIGFALLLIELLRELRRPPHADAGRTD